MPEGGYYEIKNAPLELQTLPDGQSGWNMGWRYVLWMARRLELKIFPRFREIFSDVWTFWMIDLGFLTVYFKYASLLGISLR